MISTYRPSFAVQAVAVLFTATGTFMMLAASLSFGGPLTVLVFLPLGLLTLAAGVGLCVWAWWLALGIALSGLVVILVRLWLTADLTNLSPALLTNVLIVVVLLRARHAAR
jgi:hypothetical protein